VIEYREFSNLFRPCGSLEAVKAWNDTARPVRLEKLPGFEGAFSRRQRHDNTSRSNVLHFLKERINRPVNVLERRATLHVKLWIVPVP
jgi:hypothetical protein